VSTGSGRDATKIVAVWATPKSFSLGLRRIFGTWARPFFLDATVIFLNLHRTASWFDRLLQSTASCRVGLRLKGLNGAIGIVLCQRKITRSLTIARQRRQTVGSRHGRGAMRPARCVTSKTAP
jgi:hypothetical protein